MVNCLWKANTYVLWWWTLGGVSTFAKEVKFLRLRGVWVPLSLHCEAGFNAFEKMKTIFSIAPMEFFGTPHAVRGGTRRWPLASGVLSSLARASRVHRTHRIGHRGTVVRASSVCWGLRASLWGLLTMHRTHRRESGVRAFSQPSLHMGPMSTGRVRCSFDRVRWFTGER